MAESLRIGLIDDDEAVLDALRLYLERSGVQVACFSAADAFLRDEETIRSLDCVVADVRMPGMTGIDLLKHMRQRGIALPVILITAHGEVELAVGAMKFGAFDFIEKPFDEKQLLDSIRSAVSQRQQAEDHSADLRELRSRVERLTDRQRDVMRLAAEGLSNKEIALRLHISPRTVEFHRAWMMERMQATNLAHLVRMVTLLETRS